MNELKNKLAVLYMRVHNVPFMTAVMVLESKGY
jgi:hypothetical protein